MIDICIARGYVGMIWKYIGRIRYGVGLRPLERKKVFYGNISESGKKRIFKSNPL